MKNRKKILTILAASAMMIPTSASALTKSEAIYSTLGYDGKIEKSSVTNHLAFLKENEEADETTLKDILNINGKEKFRVDGKKIIWENKGRDIFYRGITEEALPIDVEVTYFLNGKKMNPKKMVGKKGEVTISYHFINKDKKVVRVGGQNEELSTPFVVSVGTIMDGKNNKDFSITNGKVISTGTRNMIIGLASPGFYESTGIEEFKSLDDIMLTYTTHSFSLQNTYIVATPKLLSDDEFSALGKVDEVYQSMQVLDENMNKLVAGTEEVSNGATTLYDGTQTLSSNMKTVVDASSQLKNGSVTLSEGLTTLKRALVGMNTLIESKLEGKSMEEVTLQLQNLKAQNNAVIASTLQKTGKSLEELQTIYVSNNLKDYQAQGDADPLGALKNAYELILLLGGNNSAIDVSLTTLSSMQQFNTLLASVEQLEAGSITLKDGLTKVEAGTSQLYQGSKEVEAGMRKLLDGSNTLKEGTKAFQEQGINKLVGYSNTIKSYSNKIDALVSLSKDYKGFASNNSDSTLFVYTISSLKK